MKSPKTIAKNIVKTMKETQKLGKDNFTFVDQNGHRLSVTYHDESENAPYFIEEEIGDSLYVWTKYAQAIEEELVF